MWLCNRCGLSTRACNALFRYSSFVVLMVCSLVSSSLLADPEAFPSVEIGFYTHADARHSLPREHDRSKPVYLRIELIGGQQFFESQASSSASDLDESVELAWELYDSASTSLSGLQRVAWTPSQRVVVVPISAPDITSLLPGKYRVYVSLASTDGLAKSWVEDWFSLQHTKKELEMQLMIAASEGNISLVQDALRRGAFIDSINEVGMTALHAAALTGQKSTMELLMQRGSYSQEADKWGRTAGFYYFVASGGDSEQAARFGYRRKSKNSSISQDEQTSFEGAKLKMLQAVEQAKKLLPERI